jgi:threonine synthase
VLFDREPRGAVAARAAVEGLDAAVFCPAGLEREKLLSTAAYGATIYEVRGTYDDCSRLTVELSFELPWAFVNVNLRSYYAEGSKTVAFEIAEQLGWELPDAVICPVASGALFSKIGRGFGEFIELGLVEGAAPRLIGAQAQGCDPVATAYREEQPVTPVRPQTTPARWRSAIPPTATTRLPRRAPPAAPSTRCPRTRSAKHAAAGRAFGRLRRGGAGICVGALREAIRQGTVTADDRVVLCVTGDGLKTPGPSQTASPRSRSRRTPMRCSNSSESLSEGGTNFTFYTENGTLE